MKTLFSDRNRIAACITLVVVLVFIALTTCSALGDFEKIDYVDEMYVDGGDVSFFANMFVGMANGLLSFLSAVLCFVWSVILSLAASITLRFTAGKKIKDNAFTKLFSIATGCLTGAALVLSLIFCPIGDLIFLVLIYLPVPLCFCLIFALGTRDKNNL